MKTTMFLIPLVAVLLLAGQTRRVEAASPYCRIVIVFDHSGSVEENLELAWQQIYRMIRKFRAEGPKDEIFLISLDDRPELIFQGTGDQIRQAREAFATLKDKSAGWGTDVAGAMGLARYALERPPLPGKAEPALKAVVVFSDLHVDQPKDGRRFVEPEAMDWSAFRDVQVEFYYVEPEQELRWRPLVTAAGVKASFFTPAFARNQRLFEAPEAPRARVEGGLPGGVLRLLGWVVGLGALFLGVIVVLVRRAQG